jgi:excisionase family DNA binding protein
MIDKKYLMDRIDIALDGFEYDTKQLSILNKKLQNHQVSEAIHQMGCAFELIKEFKIFLNKPSYQKNKSENQKSENQKMVRVQDMAEYLGVSKSTVWLYAKQGKLTPYKMSERVTHFSIDEADKLMGIKI